MKEFKVKIIGCSSAMPDSGEISSAQLVSCSNRHYLVDCADGTTSRMMGWQMPWPKIDAVFISHIHGDHHYGLCELISLYQLNGRKQPLKIIAPRSLFDIYDKVFKYTLGAFRFPIEFIPLDEEKEMIEQTLVYEDNFISVYTIPLVHSVPTCGYLFCEKKKQPNIIIEKINQYNVPVTEIKNIKNGKDWVLEDGTIIPSSEFLSPAPEPHKYAYCSDTIYFDKLPEYVKDASLIYHECSFATKDKELAEKYGHSTPEMAALVAKNAGAKRLILGHISARYSVDEKHEMIDDARKIFSDTHLVRPSNEYLV